MINVIWIGVNKVGWWGGWGGGGGVGGGGLTVGFMKFYLAIDYTWSPKTIN